MSTIISFDPEEHKYTNQYNEEYISVTTLLGREFPFEQREIAEKVSQIKSSRYFNMSVERILEFWENGAELGTIVHNAIEDYIKHTIWPSEPTLIPMVEQFSKIRFRGDLLSETLLWSDEHMLAGTCDIMEVFPDKIYLYDIKTSNKISDDKLMKFSLQLFIYKYLIELRFKKPVIIGGIFHFDDYVMKRSKSKLKLIKPLNIEDVADDILNNRKIEVKELYGKENNV